MSRGVKLQFQGPWFDPELGLLSVWSIFAWGQHGFPPKNMHVGGLDMLKLP